MNRAKGVTGATVFGLLLAGAGIPARAADEPEVAYTLTADKGGSVASARFSADGKKVFTLGDKPAIGVWDAKTGKEIRSVELPGVRSVVALSGNGGRAVAYGEGSAVLVWDVATGKQLAELKGGPKEQLAVRHFSQDGERVVTTSEGKTAKVWEARTGKPLGSFTGHKGPVASAEFNADGARVATGSYFGEIKVWDAESGKELLDLAGMSTSNNPTMFSADGKFIVSPRFDTPAVWAAKDGKLVQEFKGHKGWCRTARLDAPGEHIVTAGQDKTARVWDVKTGETLHTLKHEDEVGFAEFSPDGSRVLTVSGGKVRVWQLPKAK